MKDEMLESWILAMILIGLILFILIVLGIVFCVQFPKANRLNSKVFASDTPTADVSAVTR